MAALILCNVIFIWVLNFVFLVILLVVCVASVRLPAPEDGGCAIVHLKRRRSERYRG